MQLYEPINTPKPVDDDIWIVDGPVVCMSMYGAEIPFPTRMVVIRLGHGGLFLWSPTEYDPALAAEIDALGRVEHLISPNKIHYAHIARWKEAYPGALAWASPGVRERAASQKIQVAFDRDLGDGPDAAWKDDIDQMVFRGSRFMDEVVFFHKKSRTLVLADLIENFEVEKVERPWSWMMKAAGCADPDGKAPLDFRMTFVGHKDIARECLEHMRSFRPERVVMAHGRWYPERGMEELQRSFRWIQG